MRRMAFGFEHIHLIAPDYRATAQWYVDYLGARIVEEYQAFGFSSIALDLMNVRMRISTPVDGHSLPGTTIETHYGIDHFGFMVDGLEAMVSRLEHRGVEVLVQVQEARPGLNICYIRGPDDTRIELLEQT